MTRIIGGAARGQRISVPSAGTRPTSDRIREALFSTLESWLATNHLSWEEISFADLYSGSGAIGLEAASRGASQVILVEKIVAAQKIIQANARRTKLDVLVVLSDVARWNPPVGVNMMFLDPPYSVSDQEVALAVDRLIALVQADPTLVVVERGAKSGDPFKNCTSESFEKKWDKAYGDSRLWYGHLVGGVT